MNDINKTNRQEMILLLEKHLSGSISGAKFLKCFPDYGDDELLESVVNSFFEPLQDTGYSSWETFTKVCITALKENWSLEKFDNHIE